MIINVSEIDENGFELNVVKPNDWLDNINDTDIISFESDLKFDIYLEKIVNELSLTGNVEFEISSNCSLCLVDVKEKKDIPLMLILSPDDNDSKDQMDDNFETYSGDQIDLSDYLKEQIALSLPFKVVCSDECKGLCSNCGINLNKEDCNCENNWQDSKFAILKNIKV